MNHDAHDAADAAADTESPRRAPDAEHPPSRVVVGVDGSESSQRALRWAARQAAWMHVPLHVVTVWDFPEHPAPLGIVARVPWPEELMAEAQAKLDEIVAATLPEPAPAGVDTVVIRGAAAAVLMGEAGEADLLVVGSTGHGSFTERLLGSVSERCVRHARCPVAVIR